MLIDKHYLCIHLFIHLQYIGQTLSKGEMKVSVKLFVVMTMGGIMLAVVKTRAARILMALPTGSKSHKIFFMVIAEHLVQRNHSVSAVTLYLRF